MEVFEKERMKLKRYPGLPEYKKNHNNNGCHGDADSDCEEDSSSNPLKQRPAVYHFTYLYRIINRKSL